MANNYGRVRLERKAKGSEADQSYNNFAFDRLKLKYLNDDKRYKSAINKLESKFKNLSDQDIRKLKSMEGILVDKARQHAVYVYKGSLYNANDKLPTKSDPNLSLDGFQSPGYAIFTRPLVQRRESLHLTTGCVVKQGVCGLISYQIQKYINFFLKQGFTKIEIDKLLQYENGSVIYNWK